MGRTTTKFSMPKFLKTKKQFLKNQIQIHISKREDCRNINYLLAQVYLIDEIEKKMK